MRTIAVLTLCAVGVFAAHAASEPTRVFTLHRSGAQTEREYRVEAQHLRSFIWLHWTQHSPGKAIVNWTTIEGESGTTTYEIFGGPPDKRHIALSTTSSDRPPERVEVSAVARENHVLFLKDRDGKVVHEL